MLSPRRERRRVHRRWGSRRRLLGSGDRGRQLLLGPECSFLEWQRVHAANGAFCSVSSNGRKWRLLLSQRR